QRCVLRALGLLVNQVHDRALILADNRAVRRVDKVANADRMPVIAASHAVVIFQALLTDRPFAIRRDNETVEIDLKSVRDRIIVDPSGESADAHQSFAVKAAPVRNCAQLLRRVAGNPAAAAADIQAELPGVWSESAFESSHDRGGDP